ncbi:MAG: hypothetical protein GY869_11900 [Planctomycetes bacterium]|nr:hypothetical protein [Planctomycetota bacterium]
MNKIFAVTLLLVWITPAQADLHLTVNGQPLDSINLDLDESCTIEVVSDESRAYTATLLEQTVDFGDMSLLEIKPAAGSTASVFPSIYYGGYDLTASGAGVTPGVHFVFILTSNEPGSTEIVLRQDTPGDPIIDTIQITMAPQQSAGSAFTYQGHLTDIQGNSAEGLFDLKFNLYRSQNGDLSLGTLIHNEVEVRDGLFSVQLDFGVDVFNGDARWLEMGVRPGALADPNTFSTIPQRQTVTPCPYALKTRGITTDDNMNVGIGAENPAAKMHILQQDQADAFRVDTTANQIGSFVIKYNGDVGIGTTNPDANLHVLGGLKLGSESDAVSIQEIVLFTAYTGVDTSDVAIALPNGWSRSNTMVLTAEVSIGLNAWASVGRATSLDPLQDFHYLLFDNAIFFDTGTLTNVSCRALLAKIE